MSHPSVTAPAEPSPGPERLVSRTAGRFRPGSAASTLPTGDGGVNPKKAGAVAAILTTRTYRAAAKAAGVGERTLRRWRREDPEFRGLLRAARLVHRRKTLRVVWRSAVAAADTLSRIARALDALGEIVPGREAAWVNSAWAPLRAAERVMEMAGLVEDHDHYLRAQVRRLESRVEFLEAERRR